MNLKVIKKLAMFSDSFQSDVNTLLIRLKKGKARNIKHVYFANNNNKNILYTAFITWNDPL